jgi:hypothetical protein
MSPASYLAAPPRVAAFTIARPGSLPPMLWLVWIALAFLLLVAGIGGWYVVRQGLAFWRTLKAFTALLGRAGEMLTARADAAAAKAAGTADAAERLTAASAQLNRSLAYARLVFGAAGSARGAYTGLRGRVPRK